MDIERILHHYRGVSGEYAVAKAHRTYIEEFRKSKIALLMREAEKKGHKTIAAQEREALCDDEYLQLLDGLQAAVAEEEALRYRLRVIEAEIEVWRTQRADNRAEIKAY